MSMPSGFAMVYDFAFRPVAPVSLALFQDDQFVHLSIDLGPSLGGGGGDGKALGGGGRRTDPTPETESPELGTERRRMRNRVSGVEPERVSGTS